MYVEDLFSFFLIFIFLRIHSYWLNVPTSVRKGRVENTGEGQERSGGETPACICEGRV